MTGAVAGVLLSTEEASQLVRALDALAQTLRETHRQPTPKLRSLTEKLRRATVNASRNARLCTSCAGTQPDSCDDRSYATVSTPEAARILGITGNGVRDLARRGVIPSERSGGRWIYPAAAVVSRAERLAAQRR